MPIPELWRALGLSGEPRTGKAVCSPLRPDKSPSFLINRDGLKWRDFSTGEHGDAVDFLQVALNISQGQAIQKLKEMTGLADAKEMDIPERIEFAPVVSGSLELPSLPELREGDGKDWYRLAELRGVSVEAVYSLVTRGMIRFCDFSFTREDGSKDDPVYSWVILDKTRCNAQVRRMDGEKWFNRIKSLSIKNSISGWSVGIAEACSAGDTILLTEGAPDCLAGMELAIQEMESLSPVAMLGAGNAIDSGALPLFRGKTCIIVPHNDPEKNGKSAGNDALNRWWSQLCEICASLDVAYLPSNVKDLNDFVRIPQSKRRKLIK